VLRHGSCERIADLVIYPGSHEHVVAIVAAANKHNVVIIPFGGGTSVTNAVMCPNDEKRTIVSLDMREMNKVKWVGKWFLNQNKNKKMGGGGEGQYDVVSKQERRWRKENRNAYCLGAFLINIIIHLFLTAMYTCCVGRMF
jgi:hypothetical protein